MWYLNKQGDAYLIKDLVALKISDTYESSMTTTHQIQAFSENRVGSVCDCLILETFLTRESCLTFKKWFLSNYIMGTTCINYHDFLSEA